jgi:hypothetical protein
MVQCLTERKELMFKLAKLYLTLYIIPLLIEPGFNKTYLVFSLYLHELNQREFQNTKSHSIQKSGDVAKYINHSCRLDIKCCLNCMILTKSILFLKITIISSVLMKILILKLGYSHFKPLKYSVPCLCLLIYPSLN